MVEECAQDSPTARGDAIAARGHVNHGGDDESIFDVQRSGDRPGDGRLILHRGSVDLQRRVPVDIWQRTSALRELCEPCQSQDYSENEVIGLELGEQVALL